MDVMLAVVIGSKLCSCPSFSIGGEEGFDVGE